MFAPGRTLLAVQAVWPASLSGSPSLQAGLAKHAGSEQQHKVLTPCPAGDMYLQNGYFKITTFFFLK